MAEAAISSLVQLLGNVLSEKVKLLRGVAGDVVWLKDELQRMQCFLRDAEEKQSTDNRIRNWISDIRKLAFDAEDAIEIFILNVGNPKKSRRLLGRCGCFPNHVYHLDRVADVIEKIKQRLEAINRSRERYGIKDLGERVEWTQIPDHVEWRRRLNPKHQDKDVVGLDKDMQSMLQRVILDDRESLSSATITGLPGIGKSTLARMVYNHDEVVERFDKRVWIVVSNEFRPQQIFKGLILELLEPSEDRKMLLETIQHEEATKLQEMVYERLQEKRYLIVLDDVWEDAHWTCLANAFPVNDTGSRLLITSRYQISTQYTRYIHFMQILDSVDTWNLFIKKALNDNTELKCPEHLEVLGREIVGKCGGLPLAINIVGGLLFKQGKYTSGWKKVLKGMNSYLNRDGGDIFNILELSYQNLSPQLKPCFLCLAFWKEDSMIRAVKLKNIWITQGLIRHEGEEAVEAIATRYLDELINRNLVQVKDISTDDQVKNCQVHDLIHVLSVTKANEEIGFEMLSGEGSSQSSDKPRHRALYNSLIDDENSRNKHIRSLFVCIDVSAAPSSYFVNFELLKLLDLEDCESLTELPEAIGSLIGLTYLGLKNTGIWKLPRSFRKLKNLEVIELPNITELPSCAWGFMSLRHVDGFVWWDEVLKKTSSLKSIHRLKCLYIKGSDHFEKLAEMTHLSYLAIYEASSIDWSKVFNSLYTLKNLTRLTLTLGYVKRIEGLETLCHVTRLKIESFEAMELPTDFPPNVSHLTLEGVRFQEDPMPVLMKLSCLSYLHLYQAYGCEEMVISSDGFSKLETLKFSYLEYLMSIQVGEGAMPELKRFQIQYCWQLNGEDLKEPLRSALAV